MVWLNDIWGYFLDEKDIEEAYLDYYTNRLFFFNENQDMQDMLKIPRVFTRAGLLREYIKDSNDRVLKKIIQKMNLLSDFELLDYYHKNFSPWYDPENYYSQWVVYAKKKIIDYAEEWCNSNGIKCTRKQTNQFETYSFLIAYS